MKYKKIVYSILLAASFGVGIAHANSAVSYAQPAADIKQVVKGVASDTKIYMEVNSKFAADPILSPFKISVKVDKGVVALSGEVETDKQYEQAIIVSSNVEGVTDVNAEHLKVKDSNQPIKDVYITAKVKGLLLKKQYIDNKPVDVGELDINTKNGTVHVSGHVNSEKEKEFVESTIKSVDGVTSVNSDGLVVKQ